MDVRRDLGDSAVFARRSHIPEEVSVQMAVGRERAEEELHPAGRGVDGRLRQVLLRADRTRSGEYGVSACLRFNAELRMENRYSRKKYRFTKKKTFDSVP